MNDKGLTVWLPAIRAGTGADVFVQRLASALEKKGHNPIVQWFDRRYEFCPWLLRLFNPPKGVDIIHAGSWQGFAFKRPDVPLVVTEHHYAAHPALRPFKTLAQSLYHDSFICPINRKSYECADALVAVSEFCSKQMSQDLARPVDMIHNWVDTNQFKPAKRLQSLSGKFRLLFVGNPSLRKGADYLPEIAKRLESGFELRCVGGLRKGLDGLRAHPNITIIDSVDPSHMPDVYHACDAVLVLSRYETFGYVALEAMACGLPVVGFNCAGTAEVCSNNFTGLLVEPGNIDALILTIKALSEDVSLGELLGAKGRRRAEEYFSMNNAIEKYLTLYNRVMRNSRKYHP